MDEKGPETRDGQPQDAEFESQIGQSIYQPVFPKPGDELEIEVNGIRFLQASPEREFANFTVLGNPPNRPEKQGGLLKYCRQLVETTRKQIDKMGVPREQFEIDNLTLRNFSDNHINQDTKTAIEQWVETMKTNRTRGLGLVNNIFLVNDQPNVWTAENQQGEYAQIFNGIQIFPAALANGNFRIKGIGRLPGTLTHEWAHQFHTGPFSSNIYLDWMKIGGWQLTERFRPRSDPYQDKWEITTRPNECITKYATNNSCDDFADSVVAAMHRPDLLQEISPSKLSFIKDRFLSKKPPVKPTRVAQVEPSEIQMTDEIHLTFVTKR